MSPYRFCPRRAVIFCLASDTLKLLRLEAMLDPMKLSVQQRVISNPVDLA